VRVSSEHVTALRSVLNGDDEHFERLVDGADEQHLVPLNVLLAMAFFSVACMRFPADWSAADVVRFVAWMRLQDGNDFDTTSPAWQRRCS
jgi:hypothetical protein